MATLPQDIMTQANAIGAGMDSAMAQGADIVSPTGRYSALALNALVAELNEILPMMGMTDRYPDFTEDQTTIPLDMLNLLMAVQSIADMAQVEFPMDLGEMQADAQIAKLAALIKRLREDSRMQDYLAMQEEPVTEPLDVEEPMGEEPMGMSDEELFTSRMG